MVFCGSLMQQIEPFIFDVLSTEGSTNFGGDGRRKTLISCK